MAHEIASHSLSISQPVLPAIQLHNPTTMRVGHMGPVTGNTIFRIINDAIQPTATLTFTAAASQLDSLFPLSDARAHEAEKEEPESFLKELWSLFIYVAEQIPHDNPAQDNLAKLVGTLRVHPSPIGVNFQGTRSRLWANLPGLGDSLTDEFNKFARYLPPAPRPGVPSSPNRFLNLNAFTSRLMRDGTFPGEVLAAWIFRGALEADVLNQPVAVLNFRVPPAAEWIQQAGKALFRSQEAIGPMPAAGHTAAGGNTRQRHGWQIYDKWRLWKQQFSRIAMDGRLEAGTRAVAKEAALDMVMIEMTAQNREPLRSGRSHLIHPGGGELDQAA